jgi:hypothetical protein
MPARTRRCSVQAGSGSATVVSHDHERSNRVPTRIVLLSVAEPVLVEQDTVEVLDRLNQPDPVLVALTRLGGTTVHVSRAAVALVEDAGSPAEAALSTTATTGASVVLEEGLSTSVTA